MRRVYKIQIEIGNFSSSVGRSVLSVSTNCMSSKASTISVTCNARVLEINYVVLHYTSAYLVHV